MNILGHKLIISEYNKHMNHMGEAYVCENCGAEISIFNVVSEILIWHNHNYIELISCEEYIIKNLIE